MGGKDLVVFVRRRCGFSIILRLLSITNLQLQGLLLAFSFAPSGFGFSDSGIVTARTIRSVKRTWRQTPTQTPTQTPAQSLGVSLTMVM